ncbi:polyketide synthase [Fusarium phyllophilum]|uniref:Polyketide synthase n=1 Tax=Fusarium phyllophilum TaxID=47803 RepID=A0A8H5MNH0_9HYPO|nr:polyketide synthase [Fusarium phyllophilum]
MARHNHINGVNANKGQPMVPEEPIAIIGTAMRLPGRASNLSRLWDMLRDPPSDLSRQPPPKRFSSKGFFHPDPEHHGTSNSEKSYFLEEDVRTFDAAFFNIAPREAEAIDPQHRLLLEVVYEALETAGIPLEKTQGSDTAVFVGQMSNDYWDHLLRDVDSVPKYMATGTARSVTANRLSYFFDWHGPSMSIDTACSSSMVALHDAVQVLRSGRSSMAVAAGCHLVLGPESYVIESKLRMISPTGTCKMWDVDADGYARAEGCAVLVLKTLSNALRDGDPIVAVVKETGVNQDGRTRGITMPSAEAQATLIRETYLRAGLNPTQPSDRPHYFEAHGTGTQAGDPVEAEAIHLAFFQESNKTGSAELSESKAQEKLVVGSIKTVVGHLEATAGLAGILKGIAAMHHKTIPPNLWFQSLNPKISPFYKGVRVPTAVEEWPKTASDGVMRCSVNSFGFGGTNAHTILECYESKTIPAPQGSEEIRLVTPLTLSAASAASLVDVVEAYHNYLTSEQDVDLDNLAFTLQCRRSALPYRLAFSGIDTLSLIKQMSECLESARSSPNLSIGTLHRKEKLDGGAPKLLGIFTGQGAQWPGMGKELFKSSKVFSDAIRKMQESLDVLPDPPSWSLVDQFKDGASSSSEEAAVAQPVSLALQVALVDTLRAAGVEFDSVIAHSSGEIAAAYTTGLISAHDAIRIAYYRGKYSVLATEGGGMMAVGMDFAEAKAFCDQKQLRGRLTAAASNSPKSTTLSGAVDALKEAAVLLGNTFHRFLKVDKAYHSNAMLPCCEPFQAVLERCAIQVHEPNDVLWVSSVRQGQQPRSFADDLKGPYWAETLHKPVLFSQALSHVLEMRTLEAVLEVGPHPALRGPSLQTHAHVAVDKGSILPYKGVLERFKHDGEAFSSCLGFLWQNFGWDRFEAYRATALSPRQPKVLDRLPGYPWDHRNLFWADSSKSSRFRHREAYHPLLGFRSVESHAMELRWKNTWSLKEMPWLKGHIVQCQVVVPGVSYLTLALEAAASLRPRDKTTTGIELHDISIHRAIIVEDEETQGTDVFVSVSSRKQDLSCTKATFNIYASNDHDKDPFHVCSGEILLRHSATDNDFEALENFDISHAKQDMSHVQPSLFYSEMGRVGLCWDRPFLSDAMFRSHHRSLLSASKSETDPHHQQLLLNPVLLDIGFQGALVGFASPGDGRLWSPYLPTHISCCSFDLKALELKDTTHDQVCFSNIVLESTLPNRSTTATFTCDVNGFYAVDGRCFVQVEGLTFSCISPAQEVNDREMFANEIWVPASLLDLDLRPHDILGAFARVDIAASPQYPETQVLTARDVDDLRELFHKDSKRINFSEYDLDGSNPPPAIAERKYDLIICTQTIKDLADFKSLLSKLYEFVKPGGSTILSVGSGHSCTQVLKNCGFKGVELVLWSGPDSRLILTKADDDSIKPSESRLAIGARLSDAIIIGEHNPQTAGIIDAVKQDTAGTLGKVTVIEGLAYIQSLGPLTDATVLCLVDLQDDTLRDPTVETLDGMKLLLENARRVLWVTQGRRQKNPFASMMVGLGRSIISETPLLNLQFLDIEDSLSEPVTQHTISQCFTKLIDSGTWSSNNTAKLWKQEPEMVLSQGKLLVPRIRPLTELNDRLNCQNRIIAKPILTGHQHRLEIARVGAFYAAHECHDDIPAVNAITISHSVCLPMVFSGQTTGYLGLGTTASGEKVVAISPNNRNIHSIEECAFSACSWTTGNESQFLASIASAIFIRASFEQTSHYVVLHHPYKCMYKLAASMAREANAKLISSVSVSERSSLEEGATVIPVSSLTTRHSIWKSISGQVGAFVYVPGLTSVEDGVLAHRMVKALPGTCKIFRPLSAASSSQHEGRRVNLYVNIKEACQTLAKSVEDVARSGDLDTLGHNHQMQCIDIGEITERAASDDIARIIDWTKKTRFGMSIRPKDPTKHLSPNKTYLMVGLTGDLGRSLVQWMLRSGARHIVLTSRSPKVSDSWLQACRDISPDSQVTVMKMDVTDEADVRSVCHSITACMPPIGGVVNAAMVMDDCLFSKLNLASFKRVVEPKVKGSMILDKVFHDIDLDFFIMFSSISCVVGNRGQSSYSAANLAQSTIAAARRSRGLSASAIALGMVVGVGYVTRADASTEAIQDNVRLQNGIPLGETDIHTIFLEAILFGKRPSQEPSELITGLKSVGPEDMELPLWHDNPRFSRLSKIEGLDDKPATETKSGQVKVPVREQLRQSTTQSEAFEVLSNALKQKLKVVLKSGTQDISNEVALVQVGVDSLSAVEIRSWFAKEVGVDVPVLKILNGASIRSLCLEGSP